MTYERPQYLALLSDETQSIEVCLLGNSGQVFGLHSLLERHRDEFGEDLSYLGHGIPKNNQRCLTSHRESGSFKQVCLKIS